MNLRLVLYLATCAALALAGCATLGKVVCLDPVQCDCLDPQTQAIRPCGQPSPSPSPSATPIPVPCPTPPICKCGGEPDPSVPPYCGPTDRCLPCPEPTPSPSPTSSPSPQPSPTSEPSPDPSPSAFPPQPWDVVRGHGILLCSVPGKGAVCQGGLTPSQNPELPQCLNGAKPKNHPNAPPFKLGPGMTCFIDSTAKIGLCDPLTLKAIEVARKNGRPDDVKGWRCPNDPDPARRFPNPCDKVSPDQPLSQCGLDQWVAAIGGCDDLKLKYGNNGRKAAEECQKRWPVSPTSWMVTGGCGLQVLDDIEARVTVNAAGCKITSCPKDDRVPLATSCRGRVMGEKN